MSDDLLQRATKALREQGGAEPPSDRAAFMRARVLSQAKRSSKLRPQGIWQWAAVVSLGFFATTAMAQVIAVQLPKVIEALRSEAAEDLKPKVKKPAHPPQPKAAKPVESNPDPEPQPEAAPPVEEPAAPSVTAEAPVKEPPPRAAKPKRSWSANIPAKPTPAVMAPEPAPEPEPEPEPQPQQLAAPSPPPKAAAPAAPAPEPAELALFRRAQALHLQHDPRAIAAWDAFLRVAGSSVLAPEARYNRALGLVRAKRFSEARDALQPFANGKYGSYRKQEAQSLLTRLPN